MMIRAIRKPNRGTLIEGRQKVRQYGRRATCGLKIVFTFDFCVRPARTGANTDRANLNKQQIRKVDSHMHTLRAVHTPRIIR
jgi:hypothetical protein